MWLLWMLSLLPTTTQVRQRVQLMMNRGISITDEVCVKLSIPPPGVDASEVHACHMRRRIHACHIWRRIAFRLPVSTPVRSS
jgi:hypothetical protein